MSDLYRGYARHFKSMNRMDAAQYAATDSSYAVVYDRFLPEDRQESILDIGCGGGHFLHYVRWRGFENHLGIEQDADLVALVKRKVTALVANEDMYDFLESAEKGRWSVVALNDLIEHLSKEGAIRLLQLVRGVLSEGGRIFIKTPNMSSPFAARSRYLDLTHKEGYTEESIASLVEVAGLAPIYVGPAGSRRLNLLAGLPIRPALLFYGQSVPRVFTANLICVAVRKPVLSTSIAA